MTYAGEEEERHELEPAEPSSEANSDVEIVEDELAGETRAGDATADVDTLDTKPFNQQLSQPSDYHSRVQVLFLFYSLFHAYPSFVPLSLKNEIINLNLLSFN